MFEARIQIQALNIQNTNLWLDLRGARSSNGRRCA